jgi:DNA helicase-2/ATP-dependent DNA helicase PcrA
MSEEEKIESAGYNPQQLEAVTAERTNMMIYAGAGSGKTKVLVSRIVYLMTVEGIPPSGIIAATFTNKAAREMKTRIADEVGDRFDLRALTIGTFHSICIGFLRRYYRDAGLPAVFSVLDDTDQLALIKQIIKRDGIEFNDKDFPKMMQLFINNCKEKGLRADFCLDNVDPRHRTSYDCIQKKKIYMAYEEFCTNAGLVDFGEMLLRVCEMIEGNVFVRNRFHSQISEILVDEFQDSNDIQMRLINDLKSENCHITVVGDDDQSIYSWRGANPNNLLNFAMKLPMVKIVKLEQNYRSTTHILNVANSLISHCQKIRKNLWTDREGGEKVGLYAAVDAFDEAGFVVNRIVSLHLLYKIPYSEFAVLYRNNSLSLNIENALLSANIPYRIVAGHRFYDRAEIKDAMAYIRLVVNPADDSAFARIVNVPPRGIGDKTMSQLVDIAESGGISLSESALRAVNEKLVRGRALNELKNFLNILDELRVAADGKRLSECVECILKDSGLIQYYQEKERKEKDEGKSRTANLEELVSTCVEYPFDDGMTHSGIDALSVFMQEFTLQTDRETETDDQNSISGDKVNLLTIHTAKGLEFDTVFLVAAEDGILPSFRAVSGDNNQQGHAVEEELRLAYVAVTRAKVRCYISFAKSRIMYGQPFNNVRSQFIDYIDKSDLVSIRNDGSLMKVFRSRAAQQKPDYPANSENQNPGGSPSVSKMKVVTLGDGLVDSNELEFSVGDRVLHQKFGEGKILNISNESYTKVTVEFINGSTKQLSLKFAGLKKLPDA